MRRRRFKAYGRGLHRLRRRCREGHRQAGSNATRCWGRLAVLKQAAGRMAAAVKIHVSR